MTISTIEAGLLEDAFRKTMQTTSGRVLDLALIELGWPDLLTELPRVAIPMMFRLLGETGAHAPVLNDVILSASGQPTGGTVPLPYAGGTWIRWDREDKPSTALDADLPLRILLATATKQSAPPPADSLATGPLPSGPLAAGPLAAGRRAVGWWLAGTGRAMLTLARQHAVDRVQFGRPLASFQAVRHRLAETLVALEGAEAALRAAGETAEPGAAASDRAASDWAATDWGATDWGASDELSSLLAKAAAGHAALTAARHCQQVLGGIGFTAEHGLHRHVRRALVLDGLLGSARELTRAAGGMLITKRTAPRLVDL
jgi:Acyl-CoA dehydrogenase, C-terminal domain